VVVNYVISKQAAERVMAEIIAQGGNALAIQGDVSKPSGVHHLFKETKRAFGKLDMLVNNAFVYEFAAVGESTREQFHYLFNTNMLALLLATQEAVTLFGEQRGSVVNIWSTASRLTPATTAVYAATLGAVDTAMQVIAKELGPKKTRVNSINPDMVETEGVHAAALVGSDFQNYFDAQTPREGSRPDDIAPYFLRQQTQAGWTGEIVRT
jgi:3-oxoacyl-[acyl-carrier protein] reductase